MADPTSTPTAGHVCTAPRCGRPAPDAFVCPSCIDQLRRDLREIAGRPTGHLSGAEAQRDTDDGLAGQLLVTMARQDRPGEHVGRVTADPGLAPERTDQPIAETAMPYKASAGDVLADMRLVLNMWVRVIVERRYGAQLDGVARDGEYRRTAMTTHPDPPARLGAVHGPWRRRDVQLPLPEVREMAWWLDHYRTSVAADPDGGRLVAEVGALVPRAQRVVFPARWEFLGPCLHWHCEAGPGGCQLCADEKPGPAEDLWAVAGADWVSCRPCGRSYDVAERRRWLLAEAEDQLVTAEFAADALPRYLTPELGRLVEPRRIRRWAEHGRITVHRPHPGDTVVDALGRKQPAPVRYQVGQLLDQVRRDAEQPPRRGRPRAVAVGEPAPGGSTPTG